MTTHSSESPMPKWLISVAAIGVLLLVILFALGIIGGAEKIAPGNTAVKPQVLVDGAQTLTLSKQAAANTLSWQGTVVSRVAVKIAPKINARILEIPVHPGDRLKKGAVIARLDGRELRAATNAANAGVAAAQAQAAQARAEANRITELYNKQAATRQNYDAVSAQAQSARAMAEQAASNAQQSKVLLGEDTLYAPFDGVVGERLQEPGDMAMPNQPIITFLKPDDLRMDVAVSEQCSSLLKLGMSATVRIDAIQNTLTGKIDEISPELDATTRSQQIKLSLPYVNGLQQGQFGWLQLGCTSAQQKLLIPATAVAHYGQLEVVKVVNDNTLKIRHIRTGKQYAAQVEVLSGLHEGDTILSNGGLAQ